MDIILVDENDKELGRQEKLKVHKEGKLHRAFSVFIFNSKNELLLQKRASVKYHSAGLWTNTCCGHPIDNIKKDAEKRLHEEMGLACNLEEKFSFIYKTRLENGLIVHEYDHVFFGRYDNPPEPNPNEVDEWIWIPLDKLKADIEKKPERYTPWLRVIIDDIAKIMHS